ncbi:7-cyano-7-deazaguanine synthase [Candidatus Palauibacter sp.]|uniref:7-cyano-7-deazaguanine synthase n=1 Tax=Candidatus Palauibacter sp. TaxID=3101350 RepID=UPI003B029B80
MIQLASGALPPEVKVAVCEPGSPPRDGWLRCELNRNIQFSTAALESYAFSRWETLIFDAMLVAASVEFTDLSCRRPSLGWSRRLSIRIPVDDPDRWEEPAAKDGLLEALEFVTGDHWSLSFFKRTGGLEHSGGDRFPLFPPSKAVLPYSEGVDSLAVAGLAKACLGDDVVRVRVGGVERATNANGRPFVSVPYRVRATRHEPTAMNRGFKFAMISGLAAYLTGANKIIIPESGQGALGPSLVSVGHAYYDYRNHPRFMRRMERFLAALLEQSIRYRFPRLWCTKGETLARYVAIDGDETWRSTKSCWRDNRWSSVRGSWRHCGVCAACMLRRVSVHAAGLSENPETYVCTDMSAATLASAVDPDFKHLNDAYRDYAIAGVRHMDDLAEMADVRARRIVRRHAASLRRVLRHTEDSEGHLIRLLERHAAEWKAYLNSLGAGSFVRNWIRGDR